MKIVLPAPPGSYIVEERTGPNGWEPKRVPSVAMLIEVVDDEVFAIDDMGYRWQLGCFTRDGRCIFGYGGDFRYRIASLPA